MLNVVRTRRTPVMLLIFSMTIGAAAYAFGVLSGLGQRAEANVLGAAAFTTDPPPPLNLVSIPSIALVLALAAGLALAAHGARRAIAVVLIPLIALVASQLLKQEFLQRPGLFELDAPNTFPSGHMTVFTVLVIAVVWALPARFRALGTLVGAAIMSVVAWQLLQYGWHRPSDIIGSLMLSVAVASVSALFSPGRPGRRAILGRLVGRLLIALGLLTLLASLSLIVVTLFSPTADAMLLASKFGAIGASLLTARAILALGNR